MIDGIADELNCVTRLFADDSSLTTSSNDIKIVDSNVIENFKKWYRNALYLKTGKPSLIAERKTTNNKNKKQKQKQKQTLPPPPRKKAHTKKPPKQQQQTNAFQNPYKTKQLCMTRFVYNILIYNWKLTLTDTYVT